MFDFFSKISGYDRVDRHPENHGTFYGFDDEDGTTLWVDEDGNQDCITKTPTENDEYQYTVDEYGDRIDD